MDDIKACIAAGTPGKTQEHLAKGVGTWQGKNTMWMAPGARPSSPRARRPSPPSWTAATSGSKPRARCPAWASYTGQGTYGYDNVSGKFVSTWIDNQSTGIMTGTGQLSADGKVMTWTFTYNCPLTKKPAVIARGGHDHRPQHPDRRDVRRRPQERQRVQDGQHRVDAEVTPRSSSTQPNSRLRGRPAAPFAFRHVRNP